LGKKLALVILANFNNSEDKMAEYNFVGGKYQAKGKPFTKSGDVEKSMEDYLAQQYAQGQGKTDIGSKLVGAYEQGSGGDLVGGIGSGLVGLLDYASSSQGKQIQAGQSKDQDYANAMLEQAGSQKSEEEARQQAYAQILEQEKGRQDAMEMAKMAAQGRAMQGTGKEIKFEDAINMAKKLGMADTEAQKYATQLVETQDPSKINIGKTGGFWGMGQKVSVVPKPYEGSGSATRTAMR
jgi:hypothetical protein